MVRLHSFCQVLAVGRLMLKGAALLLVLTSLSGVAQGHDCCCPSHDEGGSNGASSGGGSGAPELNPGSLASALTLLSGGVLLVGSRRRRP